jgi:hypothetical protein
MRRGPFVTMRVMGGLAAAVSGAPTITRQQHQRNIAPDNAVVVVNTDACTSIRTRRGRNAGVVNFRAQPSSDLPRTMQRQNTVGC